ncbi:MAG: hypothetical protein RPU64_05750 [Candidatus Sedimenticola sp. (ex Thyasira tokunagai)]
MTNSDVLSEQELKKLFNCKRRGDLQRILKQANIPFIRGVRGTVTTTVQAINTGLGVPLRNAPYEQEQGHNEIEFIVDE